MERLFNWISIALGVIGGLLAKLFGGFDVLFYVLVALVVIDYITGLLKAIYLKQVSSNIGFKGLCKKVIIFLVVVVANLIGVLMGDNLAIREVVIVFFIANEGISILENAAVVYPNIPSSLKDVLLQLRDKNGKGEE